MVVLSCRFDAKASPGGGCRLCWVIATLPPSGDLGKSELDVLGGDGFSASESGGEQSVVSEEIDFAGQAAARLEQGLLCGWLEDGQFGTGGSSPNFPVKSPYGSPGSVKLLVPPTCFWGGTRFEVPRFS